MTDQARLLSILADGRFHSGEKLSGQLGVSRSCIWQSIKKLGKFGIDIHAVTGKGYQLAVPLELLNKQEILSFVECLDESSLPSLEIHTHIGSTNKHLMDIAKNRPNGAQVCIAEYQTSGRGRRGREWVSSFGQNITMSLLKKVECSPIELSGLSLALGVSIARLLHDQGVCKIGVKWPNDILLDGRKLAGILIELLGELNGPSWVVMGIGMNLKLDPDTAVTISQSWTDLSAGIKNISRNALTGQILNSLLKTIGEFERNGLQSFHENWKKFDYYYGKPVDIIHGEKITSGIHNGIDASGALLLKKTNGEIQKYSSGEVSLRPLGLT